MRTDDRLPSPQRHLWRLTLPGFCASLVGIGLARFAYTPILPAIVAAGWFDASKAAYLGAANLAGYLAGVLAAGWASRRIEAQWLLRGAMMLGTLSLFACAWPAGFLWFFGWRFLSGLCGAFAMILAAPTILPYVIPARHGLVSGAVFMGVGVGIAASGTLVPLLEQRGLTQTWLGLGALALIATVAGWGGWQPTASPLAVPLTAASTDGLTRPLRSVYVSYALNALGLVPHMVFLVAYVARGLGQGLDMGTRYWTVYGLGSIAGPVIAGRLADLIGFRRALSLVLLVEAISIGLLAFANSSLALLVSSFVVGACTIGIVPVVLGRTRDLLRHRPAAQPSAWRAATASFALFQAGGAYLFAFVLTRSHGDYRLLFALGGGAMLIALAVDAAMGSSPSPPRS